MSDYVQEKSRGVLKYLWLWRDPHDWICRTESLPVWKGNQAVPFTWGHGSPPREPCPESSGGISFLKSSEFQPLYLPLFKEKCDRQANTDLENVIKYEFHAVNWLCSFMFSQIIKGILVVQLPVCYFFSCTDLRFGFIVMQFYLR